MPEKSSYALGVPCWADVVSRDVEGEVAFYSALLGWEAEEEPIPDGGSYAMFRLRGRRVAVAAPVPDAVEFPRTWNTYIAADDADAVAQRIEEAGGSLIEKPFEVLDRGRMALARDPQGATFGVWQARSHPGFGVVDEPGSPTWWELVTTDPAGAQGFYEHVFGYSTKISALPGGFEYRLLQLDCDPVAGVRGRLPDMTDVPPHWLVYFAVEDADAAAARATELGAGGVAGPMPAPKGRLAILRDPAGAAFGVFANAGG